MRRFCLVLFGLALGAAVATPAAATSQTAAAASQSAAAVITVNGSQSSKPLLVCTDAVSDGCRSSADEHTLSPGERRSGVEAVWTPAGTRSYFYDGKSWRLWLDARKSPRFGAWRNVSDLPNRFNGRQVSFKWIS